jgi:hypothetical protein
MKTGNAEERAKLTMDGFVACGLDISAVNQRMIEKEMVRLIKEQDKITRHACADACMEVWKTQFETIGQQTTKAIFSKACMNVKAV